MVQTKPVVRRLGWVLTEGHPDLVPKSRSRDSCRTRFTRNRHPDRTRADLQVVVGNGAGGSTVSVGVRHCRLSQRFVTVDSGQPLRVLVETNF